MDKREGLDDDSVLENVPSVRISILLYLFVNKIVFFACINLSFELKFVLK